MDATFPLPDPLSFSELWRAAQEYLPAVRAGHQAPAVVASLPLFLDRAVLWSWHDGQRSFACLCQATTQGPRWGLLGGEVVDNVNKILVAMRAHQGPGKQQFVEATSRSQALANFPVSLRTLPWESANFSSLGVGLLFEADLPLRVDIEELVTLLSDYSCHPMFGYRIVNDLAKAGSRATTVQSIVARHVPEIQEKISRFGIRLSRTLPKPGAGNSELPPGVEPGYQEYRARLKGA